MPRSSNQDGSRSAAPRKWHKERSAQDPDFRERVKRQVDRYGAEPEAKKVFNQRRKERYADDPGFREHEKRRQRERSREREAASETPN